MLDLTTLNDRVLEILRGRIFDGELLPGQRLDVDELALNLGVSKTPVKDALRRLAADGLIHIRPRRGTFVTEFTRRGLVELFDLRQMLELHSVEAALRHATPKDDGYLRTVLGEMKTHISEKHYTDYRAFLRLDHKLHGHIVWLAGNSRIFEVYESIRLNMYLVRAHAHQPVNDAQNTYGEHLDIVVAFEGRSPKALSAAFKRHERNRIAYLLTVLSFREGSAHRQ